MLLSQPAVRQKDGRALLRIASVMALLLPMAVGCNLRANRHNVKGIQAYQSGQVAQAINEFQRALRANPNSADAYYNLGASYAALGKQSNNKQWLDQSEQLYRRAISLNQQHTAAHRGLAGLLVETGREKFAFDLLQSWQQNNPGQTQPLIELARLHQEFGDKRRAGDLLTDALKLDGNNEVALLALGHIRETQGQYQLALQNYQRVLQIDPQQTDAAARVADIQNRMSQLPTGLPGNTAPPRYGTTTPNTPR